MKNQQKKLAFLVVAAMIAALYAVLTLLSYPIAFGSWQLRLSEALMLLIPLGAIPNKNQLTKIAAKYLNSQVSKNTNLNLPASNLGLSAALGVSVGCLIANYFNPENLGPIDYLGGTLATALAALATYYLAKHNRALQSYRMGLISRQALFKDWTFYLLPLPSVLFNGAIVGVYLPTLFVPANELSLPLWLSFIGIFSCCEALVVYVLGLPLLEVLLPFENKWQQLAK